MNSDIKPYDSIWINIPESLLEDLEKVLHMADLAMFKGETIKIKKIPEFIRKRKEEKL